MSSTSTSAPTATNSSTIKEAETESEITSVVPDKDKLLSDMKAFISHHEMSTAMATKGLKDSESELQEATGKVKTLNAELVDIKGRLKGAENLWKENANLKKYVEDILAKLQEAKTRNSELEATAKEDSDKIYALEKQVEKLSMFKQKVEVAQVLFSGSIEEVEMSADESRLNFSLCPQNQSTCHQNGQCEEDKIGLDLRQSAERIRRNSNSDLKRNSTAKRGKMSHVNRGNSKSS